MIGEINNSGAWPIRRCLVSDLKPGMALAVRYGGSKLIKIKDVQDMGHHSRIIITDDDIAVRWSSTGECGIDAFEGLEDEH